MTDPVQKAYETIERILSRLAPDYTGEIRHAIRVLATNSRAAEQITAGPQAQKPVEQKGSGQKRWADILKKGQPAFPAEPVPKGTRAERTLGVHVPAGASRTEKELVEEIRKKNPRSAEAIIEVKKVGPSKYNVLTTSVSARTELQQSDAWVQNFGAAARCDKDRFVVIIHGVRRQETDEKAWTQQILEQNAGLHPKLTITKVEWKGKSRNAKRHGSIMIETEEPDMANALIEKGTVLFGALRETAKHKRQWDLKQCFKCNRFGHVGTHCVRETICEKCGGSHTTRSCADRGETTCANCKTKGHIAQDWSCKAIERERRRLKILKAQDSGQYSTKRTEAPRIVQFTGSVSGSQVITAVPPSQNNEDGFTIVTKKRKAPVSSVSETNKRKPGRPRKVPSGILKSQTLIMAAMSPQKPTPSSFQEPTSPPQAMDTTEGNGTPC